MLPIIADEVYEYAVSALQTLKEKNKPKNKNKSKKNKRGKEKGIMCNFSHLVHVHFGIN